MTWSGYLEKVSNKRPVLSLFSISRSLEQTGLVIKAFEYAPDLPYYINSSNASDLKTFFFRHSFKIYQYLLSNKIAHKLITTTITQVGVRNM